MDREGADEFRFGFAVLVLKYEGDDFDEVVVKLVERIGVGVGSGEPAKYPENRTGGLRRMDTVSRRSAKGYRAYPQLSCVDRQESAADAVNPGRRLPGRS